MTKYGITDSEFGAYNYHPEDDTYGIIYEQLTSLKMCIRDSYMNKYADTMQKLNSLNQEELSEEELLYYTKTMARISKKLLEVQ